MTTITNDSVYKGTKIRLGNKKRELIDRCIKTLTINNYIEIQLPILQLQETFANKVGDNKHLMFNFTDRGDRTVCLAPEYTAVIQKLANTYFKGKQDVKLFYLAECFRGENPQKGRWRQFTQLGVEILNPSRFYDKELEQLAKNLIGSFITPCTPEVYKIVVKSIDVDNMAERGLDYYVGLGFEIHCKLLDTASQICGGGSYSEGEGFALGIDRLMMLNEMIKENDFINTYSGGLKKTT